MSESLTHNAHAQHPDHQAREPLSKSCCWEAGRRRGRLLTGGGPGAPCATVYDALCFACRVLKIMLKIGGTGRRERRSSRRSARVFDSRAHTTHRRLWHNHIQPAQPSQTEPDATPERGETIVLDHFIRLAFKKRASLRSQQSWARATPSASTSRPAHGSRSKGPL